MILDHLNGLRADFPDCLAVALIDLPAGLVLCISANDKPLQERLDGLCATAAELFEGAAATGFALALDNPKGADTQISSVMTKTETCLFLRSPADPKEALFCVCSSGVDVNRLLQSAKDRLDLIAGDQ